MKFNKIILFTLLLSLIIAQTTNKYSIVEQSIPVQIKPVQPLSLPQQTLLDLGQQQIPIVYVDPIPEKSQIQNVQKMPQTTEQITIIENQKMIVEQEPYEIQIDKIQPIQPIVDLKEEQNQQIRHKKHKKHHSSHHGKKSEKHQHKKHQKRSSIQYQNQKVYQVRDEQKQVRKGFPLCKVILIFIITLSFVAFLMKRCVVTRQVNRNTNIINSTNTQIQSADIQKNTHEMLRKEIEHHYEQANMLQLMLNEQQNKMRVQEYRFNNVNGYAASQNREIIKIETIPVGRPLNQNLYPEV